MGGVQLPSTCSPPRPQHLAAAGGACLAVWPSMQPSCSCRYSAAECHQADDGQSDGEMIIVGRTIEKRQRLAPLSRCRGQSTGLRPRRAANGEAPALPPSRPRQSLRWPRLLRDAEEYGGAQGRGGACLEEEEEHAAGTRPQGRTASAPRRHQPLANLHLITTASSSIRPPIVLRS